MAIDVKTLNEIIAKYVADVGNAFSVDRVFLFGSYTKGMQNEHSDIDICFFSRDFENLPLMEAMRALLKHTRRFKGFDIQPCGYPTSEIDNDNPFIKEVIRTGWELELPYKQQENN